MPGCETSSSTTRSRPDSPAFAAVPDSRPPAAVNGRNTPTEPTSRISASSRPSATADLPVRPSGDATYTLRLTAAGYRSHPAQGKGRNWVRHGCKRVYSHIPRVYLGANDQRSPPDSGARRVATLGSGRVLDGLAGSSGVAESVGSSQGRPAQAHLGDRAAAVLT